MPLRKLTAPNRFSLSEEQFPPVETQHPQRRMSNGEGQTNPLFLGHAQNRPAY